MAVLGDRLAWVLDAPSQGWEHFGDDTGLAIYKKGTLATVRIKCKDNSRTVKSLTFELDRPTFESWLYSCVRLWTNSFSELLLPLLHPEDSRHSHLPWICCADGSKAQSAEPACLSSCAPACLCPCKALSLLRAVTFLF